jgi:hypothetical protein
MDRNNATNPQQPYAMLGAGRLVSSLWKSGDERSGWHYQFNIYRMNQRNGHVSQRFQPADVKDLVKLCQVLASTLADDGCIASDLHAELTGLFTALDSVTRPMA